MDFIDATPTKSFASTTSTTTTTNKQDHPFDSSKDGFPSNNILVAVRIRPPSKRERETPHPTKYARKNILRAVDKQMLIFDPTDMDDARSSPHSRRALGVRSGKDLRFMFDRVFDDTAAQLDVYENTTRYVLDSVFQGYNATVFAYGATGAGKTYTMLGNELNQGVISLTMIDLFNFMETSKHEYQYKVVLSYLEVYNEQIRDLLTLEKQPPVGGLELRESKNGNVYVAGLVEFNPSTADEVLQLLKQGNENRVQYETAANSQSSRSHAVLQVIIEQTPRTGDQIAGVRRSKLSLIDLAGSERAAVTKNRGVRLVEGANINKSLLALANCINALGRKSRAYVPYRDSKLTRLLKDSLGGNCRTIMIANVSPSSLSYEDTLNTLKYANRAKNIKTVVTKNVIQVDMHISKYKEKIDDLCKVVDEWKAKYKILEEKCATSSIPVHMPLPIFADAHLLALRSLLQNYVRSYRDGISLESEYHKVVQDLFKLQLDQMQRPLPASPNKTLLSKQSRELEHKIEESYKQTNMYREQWRQCLDALSVKYNGHEERQILAYESRVFELETCKLEFEKGHQDQVSREAQMKQYVLEFVNPVWRFMKQQWTDEATDADDPMMQKCMGIESFTLPDFTGLTPQSSQAYAQQQQQQQHYSSYMQDDDSIMQDAMQEDSMEMQLNTSSTMNNYQAPTMNNAPPRSALKRVAMNHPHYVHPNSPQQQSAYGSRPNSVPSSLVQNQSSLLTQRPATASPTKTKQIRFAKPALTDRSTEKQKMERAQMLQEARAKLSADKTGDQLPNQFTDLTQQWESVKNKKNKTVQQKVNQLRNLAKTESWSMHNTKNAIPLQQQQQPSQQQQQQQQPTSPVRDEKRVRFAEKPNYMKNTLSSKSREKVFSQFTQQQQQQQTPQQAFGFAPVQQPLQQSATNLLPNMPSFSQLSMVEDNWKDGLRQSTGGMLMNKENNPMRKRARMHKLVAAQHQQQQQQQQPLQTPSSMRVLSNK